MFRRDWEGRLGLGIGARLPCLQIVKRTEQYGFVVLPRRWVVERTFSLILRSRRAVRDYERLPARQETINHWAMIIVMSRRRGRACQSHPPGAA